MTEDEVVFRGHPNIRSLHRRTIEITRDTTLSLRGDCIIGVNANKACYDLNSSLQKQLKQDDVLVHIEIIVGNNQFTITGRGDKRLSLCNKHDIVIRKSNHVCPRTLSICCNKASSDISKEMVFCLRDPKTKGIFRIRIE